MAALYFAKISAVHYKAGTADISITEKEDQVINNVPFLAYAYEMPSPGDTIAVLLEFDRGNYDKGIILGKIYDSDNKPENPGRKIFCKQFADGAKVLYDSSTKTMTITADKIIAKDVKTSNFDSENITYGTIGQR